jgi:hypothetical protein
MVRNALIFTVRQICRRIRLTIRMLIVVIGGVVVSMLAIAPKVRGLKPRRHWSFKGDINP